MSHGAQEIAGFAQVANLLGGFDLYRLDKILYLCLRFHIFHTDETVPRLDLHLRVTYNTPGEQDYVVDLVFSDVRQLRLPELGGSSFELAELEVQNIADRGWERIRFHVEDYSLSGMRFVCEAIHFQTLFLRDQEKLVPLWQSDGISSKE